MNTVLSLPDQIREKMQVAQVDAVIIPMNDPHQSEYVANHWKAIAWLSGFTGSAGTLVITQDFAGLWTDSRYFIQGAQEIQGSGFELMKLQVPHTPEYLDWLVKHLPENAIVGLDGKLVSMSSLERLRSHVEKGKIKVRTDFDPIGSVWKNRPALPVSPVFVHELQFSGKTIGEKLTQIRARMVETGVDFHLMTALDDIAWTFNLRGIDVDFNPVFYAWALIGKDVADLFIVQDKVPGAVRKVLEAENVGCEAYDDISLALLSLPEGAKLLLDSKKTSAFLLDVLPEGCTIVEGDSIAEKLKAVKNDTEIQNLRKVMERDGVALLKLYRWLESKMDGTVTEARVARKLAKIRSSMDHYYGESFPAIAGFGPNGAIVHYHPDAKKSAFLAPEGVFLLDSGGQYFDGTTDITRTTVFGTPTHEQKFHFTLVLKGHIGLARARFPRGTTGAHISALARLHLWRHGLNYGHGTGHGVGSFLNVHEGPQGISPALSGRGAVPLEVGMLTSNEPGFYLEGKYGIRIENLVLTVPSEIGDNFLEFETVTLFPIDLNLIDVHQLDSGEKQWINEYHATVLARLKPFLDSEELGWLERKCTALK